MKPLRIKLILFCFLTFFFFSPGLFEAEAADFLPLKVGNSWTFSPSYGEYGNRVDSIIGTETINDTLTYIWNRQEAPDDNYNEKRWLAKTASYLKMHQVWSSDGLDATFSPAVTVGKLNPSVGDTYFFEGDVMVSGTSVYFKTTHYIESTTDSVSVAAGIFDNCIRIRELNESKVDDVTEYEYEKHWYAPNIGPVIHRKYTSNWGSVVFSQELMSYSVTVPNVAMPFLPLLLND
jgi:hypothetical protein